MKNRLLVLSAIFMVVLIGCVKDNFDMTKVKGLPEYNPSLAAPLVTAELSLKNILDKNDNDIVQVDNEGFISLIFTDELFSSTAEEIMVLPNQSVTQNISPGIDAPSGLPSSPTITFEDTQKMTMSVGANQLKLIILKGGTFSLSGSSSINANINVDISIPSLTSNGIPFQQALVLTPNGSDNVSVDLNSYELDLTNGGTSVNELEINYTLSIEGTGQPVGAADEINFSLDITDMQFSEIQGNLDFSDATPQQDTVGISLFNVAAGLGDFSIVDPLIKLYSFNSFGASLEINFDKLEGINTISGINYDLVASGAVSNTEIISGPDITQKGQTIQDSILIEGNAVVNMIADQPKYLIYDLNVQAPNTDIFILDTSKLKFNTLVELPVHGTANGFTLIDTLGFDIAMEYVEKLTLTSKISNGFPLEFNMVCYALEDINGIWTVTDTANFFDESGLLAISGQLDAQGRVDSKAITEVNVELDEQSTQNFAQASRIIVKATGATTNAGGTNVKFYEDYSLEIKIGAIASIKL